MTPERDAPPPAPNESMASTAEVAAVVQDVQHARRGRIHWGIGKHTAELALRALNDPAALRRRSSKCRRRKRHKRML